MKNSSRLLTFLLITTLSITACSNKVQQDTSAKATLDYENNLIIKPLDEYSSDQLTENYNRLHSLAMQKCTANRGTPYTYPEHQVEIGSREYGFWNPQYIEKYGYAIFMQESSEQVPDEATQKNIEACSREDPSLQELSSQLADMGRATEIVDRLRTEARGHALKDGAWQEAREKWWGCLEDKGLTPRKGEDAWGSEQSNSSATDNSAEQEEKVRTVLLEAKCSQETGMAQTLADLEASYQAPLIRENQATLNEAKQAIQEFNTDIDNRYRSSQ